MFPSGSAITAPHSEDNVIWLVGAIVIVLFILGFLGLR